MSMTPQSNKLRYWLAERVGDEKIGERNDISSKQLPICGCYDSFSYIPDDFHELDIRMDAFKYKSTPLFLIV
jgi:hypothetical protein